jgi:hypothetical protein
MPIQHMNTTEGKLQRDLDYAMNVLRLIAKSPDVEAAHWHANSALSRLTPIAFPDESRAANYATAPAPKPDRREMMFANSGEEEADTPKRERHESNAELTGRDARAERFAEMDERDQRPDGT